MWCCHLAIVVPDPSHYRLTMHIPQGYMLLTRVSWCRIQRLVACSDRLVGWPSVSHPDVCPLIQHYEWWWHWRRRSFEADVAHAAQRPSRQIPVKLKFKEVRILNRSRAHLIMIFISESGFPTMHSAFPPCEKKASSVFMFK